MLPKNPNWTSGQSALTHQQQQLNHVTAQSAADNSLNKSRQPADSLAAERTGSACAWCLTTRWMFEAAGVCQQPLRRLRAAVTCTCKLISALLCGCQAMPKIGTTTTSM
jgi:hypothetical protein